MAACKQQAYSLGTMCIDFWLILSFKSCLPHEKVITLQLAINILNFPYHNRLPT